MSMGGDIAKGKKGDGSHRGKDLASAMFQKSMPDVKMREGLAHMMWQKPMKARSGRLKPGSSAESIGRSMGQGGR